jgi:hypothetical protein
MKILTVVSNSHNDLLKTHFLPSIPSVLTPIVEKVKQHGNGEYGTEDFFEAMREKLQTVIRYTEKEIEPFIYSDVDVRFNPLLNPVPTITKIFESTKSDMICQKDFNAVCCGFMIIIPSKKNVDYLQAVMDYMNLPRSSFSKTGFHDQFAFNELLHSNLFPHIERPKITTVSASEGFGNLCHINNNVPFIWEPENDIMMKNKNTLIRQFMWHANFTVGVKNKMAQLEEFRIICEAGNIF